MMIDRMEDHILITHKEYAWTFSGHIKLLYEDNGLTVIVNSIPEIHICNVSIKDIKSDITIELEPTF